MGGNTKGALQALTAFAIFSAHDVVVKLLGGSYSPFQMIFFSALFSFPIVTIMLMSSPTKGNLRPVHPSPPGSAPFTPSRRCHWHKSMRSSLPPP